MKHLTAETVSRQTQLAEVTWRTLMVFNIQTNLSLEAGCVHIHRIQLLSQLYIAFAQIQILNYHIIARTNCDDQIPGDSDIL